MKVNRKFDNLVPSYLFAEIAKRVNDYQTANPDKDIIRLGIGDVTLPLAPVVVDAMKKGADDLAKKETFKGYPDYEGYAFVREKISDYYKSFGVSVSADEILISDGAKSDCGNIGDIFDEDNVVSLSTIDSLKKLKNITFDKGVMWAELFKVDDNNKFIGRGASKLDGISCLC